MSEYITVAGLVQFDPRNRTAGGKEVRDVVIRSLNSSKNFSITVWPENSSVEINKGDFLIADGKYTQSVGQNKEGEETTYHNLSASKIIRIAGNETGAATSKPKLELVDPTDAGDDFPF